VAPQSAQKAEQVRGGTAAPHLDVHHRQRDQRQRRPVHHEHGHAAAVAAARIRRAAALLALRGALLHVPRRRCRRGWLLRRRHMHLPGTHSPPGAEPATPDDAANTAAASIAAAAAAFAVAAAAAFAAAAAAAAFAFAAAAAAVATSCRAREPQQLPPREQAAR
jgi:hypothetical protein